MKRIYWIVGEVLLFVLLSALLGACSGGGIVKPARLYQDLNGKQIKSAYIVEQEKSYRDIELHVQKALTENGIMSSTGPLANKPDTVDIFVKVIDQWVWDMAMYLRSLDISFYENSSQSLLTTGKYETFGMHGYPDPAKVTKDVVQSMLTKMDYKKPATVPQQ